MEEFLTFNLIVVDASQGEAREAKVIERGPVSERVDLIARQFRDVLREGDPADDSPHGLVMTHDFKLRRKVTGSAAWVSFMVDRGDGVTEELDEVAQVVLASKDDSQGRAVLGRIEKYADLGQLPAAPLAVVVEVKGEIPSVIREWYSKLAAGFFTEDY